jgi:hypothetical protein
LDCLPNHTVSHPEDLNSQHSFSFCDNLYAFPHERLQPSSQTTNLTTCHLKSGHEKNEIFFIICCAVASSLPAFSHCHQFSLVLQGSLSGVTVFSFSFILTDSSAVLACGGRGD